MKSAATALDDATALCDTLIGKYPDPLDLPPVGRWHYHQGVFLLGMLRLGHYLKSERYLNYVDRWTGNLVGPDGELDCAPGELDALQAGNLLFHRLNQDSPHRFQTALDSLVKVLDSFPRTDQGGFWHKLKYPDQQWLDGLYMIGPLCSRYAVTCGRPELLDEMVRQAGLIAAGALDESTGLLRHGFDRSLSAPWVTGPDGRAPEVWGRALGWFPAALLDMVEWYPIDHPGRRELEELFQKLIPPIVALQDTGSGLWFQIPDKGRDPENWLETSCSALFIYSVAKGIRLGLLGRGLQGVVESGYEGLQTKTSRDRDGNFTVGDICIGTGIGDYRFYLERPRSANDLHGAGTFLMAALETAILVEQIH